MKAAARAGPSRTLQHRGRSIPDKRKAPGTARPAQPPLVRCSLQGVVTGTCSVQTAAAPARQHLHCSGYTDQQMSRASTVSPWRKLSMATDRLQHGHDSQPRIRCWRSYSRPARGRRPHSSGPGRRLRIPCTAERWSQHGGHSTPEKANRAQFPSSDAASDAQPVQI